MEAMDGLIQRALDADVYDELLECIEALLLDPIRSRMQ
jgi:hypothetical protein